MSPGACFADAFGSNILTSLADAQHLKRVGPEFMTRWLMPCYTCEPALVFLGSSRLLSVGKERLI
jgi:hypothetical protein